MPHADSLITLPRAAPARVLALGAFLKNTVCRLDGREARLSPVHGDLGSPEACRALEASAERLLALGPVDAIAHDLHPDLHGSRVALALAERLGVPALAVQHHHAHLAVVQAEHGLDGPLVGLALDGFGLGSDGGAWGGEGLWLDGPRWQRRAHLEPVALPGGEVAAREPWRLAAAVLHRLGRAGEISSRFGPQVGGHAAATIAAMLASGLQAPATTSAGRWFDAVAGLLGLSLRQAAEAEAAIALERAAASAAVVSHGAASASHDAATDDSAATVARASPARLGPAGKARPQTAPQTIPLADLVAEVLADAAAGTPAAVAAAARRFHLGLADRAADWCRDAAREAGTDTVALGGGCFHNRLLRERLAARLGAPHGLRVRQPQAVDCGDAGLAVGQAWAAALLLATVPTAREAARVLEPMPCA